MAQEQEEVMRLLNLTKHQQSNVDKINLYIKDSFQSKFQLLINVKETVGIKELKKSRIIH